MGPREVVYFAANTSVPELLEGKSGEQGYWSGKSGHNGANCELLPQGVNVRESGVYVQNSRQRRIGSTFERH